MPERIDAGEACENSTLLKSTDESSDVFTVFEETEPFTKLGPSLVLKLLAVADTY